MNDFLNDLYSILTETIQAPKNDPEYQRASQVYLELEEEVKEKIGGELLSRYQQAWSRTTNWEGAAIFTCGLRFGAQFVLEVLRQS